MPYWVPYFALIVLPFLVVFPFNVVGFWWGIKYGRQPMPKLLALRSKKIDNLYGVWLRDALLLLIVVSLAVHYSVPFSRMGLHLSNWRRNLLIGIGASSLQVSVQWFVRERNAPAKRFPVDARLLEESSVEWNISNIVSVFAQEVWIAFCTLTLKQSGRSTLVSLVLIAIVFGAAHYQYKLGALATALYGVLFASLFLWRASLLPSFLVHYVGNVAAFYFARSGRPAQPTSTLAGGAPTTQ
jgi:membrane protease YdiL (CAAX protease family)